MTTPNKAFWLFVTGSLLLTGCGDAPPQQSSQSVPEKSIVQTAPGRDVSPSSISAAVTPENQSPEAQTPTSDSDAVSPANASSELQTQKEAADVIIAMENCKATRPGKITAGTSVLKMVFAGPPKDKLVKRGTVQVDGQDYTLYLPKADSYSTKNTESNDNGFENTSTLISVDHNGDGRLTDDEGWFANLPLRLGDKMFDVAELAQDGTQIVLKPSQSPIRGVIVGRTCPAFSFKTVDGDEASFTTLAGKAFILDIWSYT
jgi:hypothetical protein